jgi:hypothetical protein
VQWPAHDRKSRGNWHENVGIPQAEAHPMQPVDACVTIPTRPCFYTLPFKGRAGVGMGWLGIRKTIARMQTRTTAYCCRSASIGSSFAALLAG